jgi:hypothetical protein
MFFSVLIRHLWETAAKFRVSERNLKRQPMRSQGAAAAASALIQS